MPQLSGLVFDLEGTLVDSAQDVLHALNHTMALLGRRSFAMAEVRPAMEEGLLTLLQHALNATGGFEEKREMDYFKEFITYYRAAPPDPAQILPGTLPFLERCRAAGIKLGVCTNRGTNSTEDLLNQLGLAPFFGFVAGGDCFEVHKPNPGHLLGVLQALQILPEEAVMIGDSRKDMQTAKNANVTSLLLIHAGLPEDGATGDCRVSRFEEVPAALAALDFQMPMAASSTNN